MTTSPSMSWSTPSGTSMRQFAAASAVRCRASGAVTVPSSWSTLVRNWTRPARVRRVLPTYAAWPGSRRRHPVASVEGGAHEHVEGDEGADRRAGQADDGRGAVAAEPLRPTGLHREVHEVEGRQRLAHLADDLVGAGADAAGRDDEVDVRVGVERVEQRAQVVGLVGAHLDAAHVAAGGLGERGDHVGVGLVDAAGAGVGLGRRELGAGGDDGDPRRHVDVDASCSRPSARGR